MHSKELLIAIAKMALVKNKLLIKESMLMNTVIMYGTRFTSYFTLEDDDRIEISTAYCDKIGKIKSIGSMVYLSDPELHNKIQSHLDRVSAIYDS